MKIPHLSPREREVLPLMLAGECIKETSKRLNISESTVKLHRRTIYRKFGFSYTGRSEGVIACRLLKLLGHFELRFIPNEEYNRIIRNPVSIRRAS